MVGKAAVEAKRNELLQLKSAVKGTSKQYKTQANLRISRQKEMAELVLFVQQHSRDTPLVEDVILASLWAETRALRSKEEVPDKPEIDPANQPSGTTKSAEEAIAVYSGQIDVLTQDQIYRQALLDNEAAMAKEFGEGLEQIRAIVDEYCTIQAIRNKILAESQNGAESSTD